MRQCAADVSHVFANRSGNKTVGNVSCYGKNYYSYSTIFGQWVDENVVLIYTGKTTPSSTQHQLGGWVFPSYVNVFEYSDNGRCYHGCDILGCYERWKVWHRNKLIDYYVERLYQAFREIKEEPKKYSYKVDYTPWGDIQRLCKLYKDVTVSKWLKIKDRRSKEWILKKRMIKALYEGVTDTREIFVRMYDEKSWDEYQEYIKKFKKADDLKARTNKIAMYLGMSDPYAKYRRYCSDLTPKQIRKLTPKERLDIKFGILYRKECDAKREERERMREKSYKHWFKWVTGYAILEEKNYWGYKGIDSYVRKCRNMFTGEEYEIDKEHRLSYTWELSISVNLDSIRFEDYTKALDKKKWLQNLYAEVKEAQENLNAQKILVGLGAQQTRSYDWFEMTEEVEQKLSELSDEQIALVNTYFRKKEEIVRKQEAQKRAFEIRRKREQEEKERERLLQEQIKKEQIDECFQRGVDGARDLWRLHYENLSVAIEKSETDENEFYYGGNILMRFSINKDIVETSKLIRLDIDTCKKFFRLIKIWHNNPKKFKQCEINTHYSGKYTITSYENDILTAGCHKIAYAEMERMYNDIVSLEKEVA